MGPKRKAPASEGNSSKKTSARVEEKSAADLEAEKKVGVWKQDGSLLYLESSECLRSADVLAFDMDDTLITPKSGKVFPVSRQDWRWLFPSVPEFLRKKHAEGKSIIIFSNQGGINGKNGWDESKANSIRGKICDLSLDLGFPIQAYLATTDDVYRKPATNMWDFMVAKNKEKGVVIDPSRSWYIGDAAGRPVNWKPGRKKDFSCGDRKFAFNCKVQFATPEEFFLGEAPAEFDWDGQVPSEIPKNVKITDNGLTEFHKASQEMVVFVGFPAAGKSTFAKRYLLPHGYVHVNRDTLKTPAKCLKTAEDAIASKKSVVIDNTSPAKDTRAEYISLAKAAGVPVRCFYFQTSLPLAQHLNYFRERITAGEQEHVPRIGYAMYKKKFEEPTMAEGFSEILKINFSPKFDSPDHEALFGQFAA